jgi:hypothetical protein
MKKILFSIAVIALITSCTTNSVEEVEQTDSVEVVVVEQTDSVEVDTLEVESND